MSILEVFKAQIDAGVAPCGQLCVSIGGRIVVDEAYKCTPATLFDLASLTKVLATTWLVAQHCELTPQVINWLEHCAGHAAHRRFDERASGKEAIVALARAEPLEYTPRTKAVYSDLGFILLGDHVEKTTGKTLRELMPRDTYGVFYGGDDRADDVFAPTENGVTGVVHDENARAMGGAAGHAGLFGTARQVHDLGARWLKEGPPRFFQRSPVPESTRALGWDTPSQAGSSTGDLWPATAVGHLGFTGTSLWMEPEKALIVSMVTNRVATGRYNLDGIREMRRLVHSAAWTQLTG